MTLIPSASGIYKITCTITSKFYLGSTTNLRRRWYEHSYELRHNIHKNPKLQRAWNKYGEDAFVFEVVEFILPPFLLEREQYWLDKLQPFGNKGYNCNRSALFSWLGMKHTPETIAKLRLAKLGKKRSPEAIARTREGLIGLRHDPEDSAIYMKTLIVTSPDGIEYLARGIKRFCRDHLLDYPALLRTAQGKQKQHKGWKARFPETDAG